MKRNFYFTFGIGQENAGCYVVIEALSSFEARDIMFSHFGQKWAFEYSSAEAAGVEEYGLKEIKLSHGKRS